MLAIARGLMALPKLLMLDEPSLGLAPVLVAQVLEVVRNLKERRNDYPSCGKKRNARLKLVYTGLRP